MGARAVRPTRWGELRTRHGLHRASDPSLALPRKPRPRVPLAPPPPHPHPDPAHTPRPPTQCAGVRPTSHTVGLLLGALVSSGQVGHSLWLVREALASSYELGTASFNTVLQLLAACGEWGASLGLFRAMRLAGPKAFPDGASAGLLVAACMQGGNAELAGQLTAELAGQGLLQPVGGAAGGAAWPGAGSPPTQPPLPVPLPLPLPLPLSMQADGGQQEDGHGGGKGAACGEHTDGRQHNGARGERADGRQHNGERGGGCMPHGGAAAKALHNNGASSNESPKGVTGSYASVSSSTLSASAPSESG